MINVYWCDKWPKLLLSPNFPHFESAYRSIIIQISDDVHVLLKVLYTYMDLSVWVSWICYMSRRPGFLDLKGKCHLSKHMIFALTGIDKKLRPFKDQMWRPQYYPTCTMCMQACPKIHVFLKSKSFVADFRSNLLYSYAWFTFFPEINCVSGSFRMPSSCERHLYWMRKWLH